MVAFLAIVFGMLAYAGITIEEFQEAECECTEACEELGYDFLRIRKTHGTIECYCLDGNETVRR